MGIRLPLLVAGVILCACSRPDRSAPLDAPAASAVAQPLAFTLTSPDIEALPGCGPGADATACALFKTENTRMGADHSPAFAWKHPPPGTGSFAIALHDLNHLRDGDPFTHWVMWNIPGTRSELPARLPPGKEPGVPAASTRQTSFRSDHAYTGSGACGNVYEIVLYALSRGSFAPQDPDRADAVEAELIATDALLGKASLRARCDPSGPCQEIHR